MPAQTRKLRERLIDLAGHCDIGEKHELLDHGVGLLELLAHHVDGVVRLRVEAEADLVGGEGEGAAGDASRPQDLGDAVEAAQARGEVVLEAGVVDFHLGLVVGERGLCQR